MTRSSTSNSPLRYEATAADRDAVRRIIESTAMFLADEVDVAVELVDERLAKGAASGYEFLFADDAAGRTVGYACFGRIACTVASFDLYWIAVEKSQQRSGLGRRLLLEAERLIREQSGRRVYIETSNLPQYRPTRGFYERHGYHCEAILQDFYAPGDDKVIFVKPLVGQ